MSTATAVSGVGTAISAYGNQRMLDQKAQAYGINAQYYGEQADYANMIGQREEDLFKQKAAKTEAAIVGAYAKAGVDISGSPLLMKEAFIISREREINAIRAEREKRVRLARIKQQEASNQADWYSSPEAGFLSFSSTILGGAGNILKGEEGI